MIRRKVLFGLAATLVMSVAARAADENSFFVARRQALMKKIEGSIAVLQGAQDTRGYAQFRQSNDFYYLTGVEAPGASLLIDAVEHRSILFLPPRNPRAELYEGPHMTPGEEARKATGMDDVLAIEALQAELERRKGAAQSIYTPFRPEELAAMSRDRAMQYESQQEQSSWDGRPSREKAFGQNLKKRLGESMAIQDLSPILDGMRRIKDAQEIERLRQASHIGALGLRESMRSVQSGQFEFQIAAVADLVFRWEGAQGQAYFPIVGSGPNSCVLHYNSNSRKALDGEMIVMDFGPDYRYYQSDITRSFPVSGKFTQEQRKVYSVVLEAQKAALAKVRPGATFQQINDAAREVINAAGYGKYWLHGVSHYVGLAVHDVGPAEPLAPGIVLTVEPGVYIAEKQLGVRIEDTVLVTQDGCEILSREVPKEMSEIERLMSEKSSLLFIKK